MPALAVVNKLSPTWLELPDLTLEENQLVAIENPFFTIHNLRKSIEDCNASSKTLFLPIPQPASTSVADLLSSLHCRTTLPVMRPDVVQQVADNLLLTHPLKGGHTAESNRAQVNQLMWMVRGTEGVSWVQGQQDQETPLGTATTHHFTAKGPSSRTLYSVLVPDSTTVSPHLVSLAKCVDLEARLCPSFDKEQQCGMAAEREVPVSERKWLHHRLGHVTRSGPANSPLFQLGMLVKCEVNRILERKEVQGWVTKPLAQVPGTSEYYQQIDIKLQVMRKTFGPPVYLLTTSMNTETDECLATYVSHYGGSKELPVEVWHLEDERRLLTLLPGNVEPGDEGDEQYFTHSGGQAGREQDTCRYHVSCFRQPLSNWRPR